MGVILNFPTRGRMADDPLSGYVLASALERVVACLQGRPELESRVQAILNTQIGGQCRISVVEYFEFKAATDVDFAFLQKAG